MQRQRNNQGYEVKFIFFINFTASLQKNMYILGMLSYNEYRNLWTQKCDKKIASHKKRFWRFTTHGFYEKKKEEVSAKIVLKII